MSSVYLIYNDSDYRSVIAAFSSKEACEKASQMLGAEMEECELDISIEDLPPGCKFFDVVLNKDGTILACDEFPRSHAGLNIPPLSPYFCRLGAIVQEVTLKISWIQSPNKEAASLAAVDVQKKILNSGIWPNNWAEWCDQRGRGKLVGNLLDLIKDR